MMPLSCRFWIGAGFAAAAGLAGAQPASRDPLAPLPDSPAHAVIDFGQRSEKECRKLAKRLRDFAVQRGCLHPPTPAPEV